MSARWSKPPERTSVLDLDPCPLREWVAAHLAKQGLKVDAAQVLITNGSQQAFAPYEPELLPVAGDDEGPTVEGLAKAKGARFLYMLPSFQNPTGRCLRATRREALMPECPRLGLPVLEDNPYGDLWYDEPPAPPLATLAPDGVLYLGSFSKVLAPGLRLGYLVAPTKLFPKLLQAKQAADLHTPGFNQRVVFEVIKDGFLDRHVPTIRARYRTHRDAMATALERYMPAGSRWQLPRGGMVHTHRMAENKTKPTGVSPQQFVDEVEHPRRREDAKVLLELMTEVTGQPAVMWGPTIVGFGLHHYIYDSGREGDTASVGFSPRKASLVLYGLHEAPGSAELLPKLGKFKSSVACLYVNKLDDIDLDVLRELTRLGYAHNSGTFKSAGRR